MFIFDEPKIDRLIERKRTWFFLGIGLLLAPIPLPGSWKTGAFTGFMLINLGVFAGSFRTWRYEPGIWMLGGFLAVLSGLMFALWEFEAWRGMLAGPGGLGPGRRDHWAMLFESVDATTALAVYTTTIRLSASVAIHNRRRTRSRPNELR